MNDADQPQLACPACGHSLRGLEPLGPGQVLCCPECGGVTSIRRLAEAYVTRRRQLTRLGWGMLILVALAVLVMVFSQRFRLR